MELTFSQFRILRDCSYKAWQVGKADDEQSSFSVEDHILHLWLKNPSISLKERSTAVAWAYHFKAGSKVTISNLFIHYSKKWRAFELSKPNFAVQKILAIAANIFSKKDPPIP